MTDVKTKSFSLSDLHELMPQSDGPYKVISYDEMTLGKGDVLTTYVFEYLQKFYEFEIYCHPVNGIDYEEDRMVPVTEVEAFNETVTRYRPVIESDCKP